MQPLIAPPRAAFTDAQIRAALTGADQHWSYGVDLLDRNLNYVDDLSPDVSACTVTRDCTTTVHGSINFTVARELRWGSDRVRPYIVLDSAAAGVTGARFNMGVYIPQVPQATVGQTPTAWKVTGQDQLALTQYNLSDSFAIAPGANILNTVSTLIRSAGLTAPQLIFDSTKASAVYPAGGYTWPMFSDAHPTISVLPTPGAAPATTTQGPFAYITIINDLLATIGYTGLWADWDGNLRSGVATPYGVRPPEWSMTVGDLVTGIVADRTADWDVWQAHNRWYFYMNGLYGQPVAGQSLYVKDNLDNGPASQLKVGLRVAPPQGLDAVDYTSLVVQGDAIADAEARGTRTLTLTTSKMPVFWHKDVVLFTDPAMHANNWTLAGQTWSLNLADLSDQNSTWQVVG